MNEEELRLWNSIAEQVDNPIVHYDIADYDSDGNLEMFAIVSELGWDYYDRNNMWHNMWQFEVDYDQAKNLDYLWYAGSAGAELVREGGIKVWFIQFERDRYICLEPYSAVGAPCYVFGVRDGKWFSPEISFHGANLQIDDDGNIVYTQMALDSGVLDLGRNRRPYWLYYDEKERDFKEYGGIEITLPQLVTLENSKLITDAIKDLNDKYSSMQMQWEYEITSILYRENGYIHVNLQYSDEEGNKSNKYITARYQGRKISEIGETHISRLYDVNGELTKTIEEYEAISKGIFLPALCHEIAVYPDITSSFN